MRLRIKTFDIYIYLVIIFLILAPFLFGTLFLTDFIPIINKNLNGLYGMDDAIYEGVLYFNLISMEIPIIIFQKIIFFMILFLSGYTMYNLMQNIVPSKIVYYSCLLYMINPYVYIRIIVGHWLILLSYAIVPLLLKMFITLIDKKKKKEMLKFTFLLSIVAFNIHMLIISLIIMIIIFIFWFNKYKDIKITKLFAISGILFILLNSYWIIPVLTAKNTIVDNITDKDLEVFAPKGGLFDIVSMYGFWREGYLYAKDFLPGWQIFSLIIISLAIIGFIFYYKDQKIGIYVKTFGVIWIIGFILASGVNGPFGDIVRWLFENTIMRGFRDSQKFVAVMVLSYAVLGGLGINKIKSISIIKLR